MLIIHSSWPLLFTYQSSCSKKLLYILSLYWQNKSTNVQMTRWWLQGPNAHWMHSWLYAAAHMHASNSSNQCNQAAALCTQAQRRQDMRYCKVAGSALHVGITGKQDGGYTQWTWLQKGLSSLGQKIIHLPVARVVYGWWAVAYKLVRMQGAIGYVANHAIW